MTSNLREGERLKKPPFLFRSIRLRHIQYSLHGRRSGVYTGDVRIRIRIRMFGFMLQSAVAFSFTARDFLDSFVVFCFPFSERAKQQYRKLAKLNRRLKTTTKSPVDRASHTSRYFSLDFLGNISDLYCSNRQRMALN